MDQPKRKRIRLETYNYASPGAYFLTICTRGRKMLLWKSDAVGAAISRPQNAVPIPCRLSAYGELVEQAIQNIPHVYPEGSVDRYVIMPNHVHLLLQIGRRAADSRPYDETDGASLERVIGQMKRWVSRQAGFPMWQKSYYDHVVRSEKDYLEI